MAERVPTIYDVAEDAGVSISTVSRALNAPESVKPATRRRIMQAVERLHFVPKAEASAQARKNIESIGVLLPFFTSPSFVQRMRGVAAALAGTKFELIVYTVATQAQLDEYVDVIPLWRRLDGLLVMSMPLTDSQIRHMRSHRLEVVCVELAHPQFSSVVVDNREGGKLAGRLLSAKGRRRCAFMGETGVPEHIIHLSDIRLQGFQDALHEAGHELPNARISRRPYSKTGAEQQARELLTQTPRPDAVFAYSDLHAGHVLRVAREMGIRVPEDLAVVGFDGTDLSEFLGLTTVDQSLDESGRRAAELLMGRIAGPERTTQTIRLPLRVVERFTT